MPCRGRSQASLELPIMEKFIYLSHFPQACCWCQGRCHFDVERGGMFHLGISGIRRLYSAFYSHNPSHCRNSILWRPNESESALRKKREIRRLTKRRRRKRIFLIVSGKGKKTAFIERGWDTGPILKSVPLSLSNIRPSYHFEFGNP